MMLRNQMHNKTEPRTVLKHDKYHYTRPPHAQPTHQIISMFLLTNISTLFPVLSRLLGWHLPNGGIWHAKGIQIKPALFTYSGYRDNTQSNVR